MEDLKILSSKDFYTNSLGISVGAYDFTLNFRRQFNKEAIEDIKVFMSPQHAKRMLMMLQESVESYEKVFGQINIEPNKDELEALSIDN